MTAVPGDRRHPSDLDLDAVIRRPAEASDGWVKTDMPCCDLGLELADQPGAASSAGCPRCQLAYTVEVVGAQARRWARFTLIGPIAIASPRRPPAAKGLAWHPLGQRTHLVTVDNALVGIVSRDPASDIFTARRCGAGDRLPRTFSTVEAAALALGGVLRSR